MKTDFRNLNVDPSKKNVAYDYDYLVQTIDTSKKENFYSDLINNESDVDQEIIDYKEECITRLHKQLVETKLTEILTATEKKSEHHKNATFLKRYLERLFESFYTEDPLYSIFKDLDTKLKFYKLLNEYLYKWHLSLIEKLRAKNTNKKQEPAYRKHRPHRSNIVGLTEEEIATIEESTKLFND